MPNSEAGCEQSNSKYSRMKNKLSSSMQLPMIKACMGAKSNGPPLHQFNPSLIRLKWLADSHKYVETLNIRRES